MSRTWILINLILYAAEIIFYNVLNNNTIIIDMHWKSYPKKLPERIHRKSNKIIFSFSIREKIFAHCLQENFSFLKIIKIIHHKFNVFFIAILISAQFQQYLLCEDSKNIMNGIVFWVWERNFLWSSLKIYREASFEVVEGWKV